MMTKYTRKGQRIFAGCGVLLLCLFNLEARRVSGEAESGGGIELLGEAVAIPTLPRFESPALQLHRTDPLAYLREARRGYDHRIRDYVCLFEKQERLHGLLSEPQVSKVKFREGPFSVFMHVVENANRYRRVIYVKDRIVKNGQQHAVVEPEGAVARFLVKSVVRPIDGPEARKSSRKPISQFGFARSLELIIRYATLAAERDRLDLRYVGAGEVDGRPTHRFERRLPLDDPSVQWPDALLVFDIDQEWQLPVACYAYGDSQGTELLGKYVYTDVALNVDLQDLDFSSDTYGL